MFRNAYVKRGLLQANATDRIQILRDKNRSALACRSVSPNGIKRKWPF